MPKFIRVKSNEDDVFISTNDIHWIRPISSDMVKVAFASPGMRGVNFACGCKKDLSHIWTLDEIVALTFWKLPSS